MFKIVTYAGNLQKFGHSNAITFLIICVRHIPLGGSRSSSVRCIDARWCGAVITRAGLAW